MKAAVCFGRSYHWAGFHRSGCPLLANPRRQTLPPFLPGFVPESTKPHFNHGLGALIIGLAALAFAWWFRSRAD